MKLTTTTFVSLDGVMQGIGGPDEDRQRRLLLTRVLSRVKAASVGPVVPSEQGERKWRTR